MEEAWNYTEVRDCKINRKAGPHHDEAIWPVELIGSDGFCRPGESFEICEAMLAGRDQASRLVPSASVVTTVEQQLPAEGLSQDLDHFGCDFPIDLRVRKVFR